MAVFLQAVFQHKRSTIELPDFAEEDLREPLQTSECSNRPDVSGGPSQSEEQAIVPANMKYSSQIGHSSDMVQASSVFPLSEEAGNHMLMNELVLVSIPMAALCAELCHVMILVCSCLHQMLCFCRLIVRLTTCQSTCRISLM
jgi:hypothetical protein